ncbi:MAG: hypothetical protein H6625_09435 [Bdellovibrionaceae bacterium]|nr:hypothetical protein [Pseudobdellovibrionaceae bacterium]
MKVIRKKDLMPELVNQNSGPHLTAYICNESFSQLKMGQQIEQVINSARKLLLTEYSEQETNLFLAPIQRLASKQNLFLSDKKGGWALFRTNRFFRLMKLPTSIKNISVIAQSFHIKPILKWTQKKEENYILTIDISEARLYESLYGELRHLDTLVFNKIVSFGSPKDKYDEKLIRKQNFSWIDSWLVENLKHTHRTLILAGEKELLGEFSKNRDHLRINSDFINGKFLKHQNVELKKAINTYLHEASGRKKKKLLKQLKRAEQRGLLDCGLHSVARNAIMNKITRLYVAEDTNIWGILNKETGELKVHPKQLNCFDDDLLDDISEVVLKNWAEVVVLPKKEMPRGSLIAAILKPEPQLHPKYNFLSTVTIDASQSP